MHCFDIYDEMKQLILAMPTEEIFVALNEKDPEYGLWFKESKILGFANLTPQQIVEQRGKSVLIEYLEFKRSGGFE